MKYRVCFLALAALSTLSATAIAADLPAIKVTNANAVPQCATPGRLMEFARGRNGRITDPFAGTATEYMRHGEALKVRWDYAFFQMLVETANLSFVGDVSPSQFNFAGLGATGGGVPGERFENLSMGVKAHLQHVLMYSGETIDNPVADRTRKVQEWGVLTKWQRSIRGPMTFAHLTRQWSPKDRGYARDIEAVANAFYTRYCNKPDPHPEWVAEARGQGVTVDTAAALKTDNTDPASSKAAVVASRSISETRKASGPNRLALGTGSFGATMPATDNASSEPPASFTVLNGGDKSEPASAPARANEETKLASAAGAAARAGSETANEPAVQNSEAKSACRVWQASYGGQKAVIIQAMDAGQTNYTVLDVNEGREQREVAAYIAAYAKNGKQLGEFPTSNKALNKAFELCPES